MKRLLSKINKIKKDTNKMRKDEVEEVSQFYILKKKKVKEQGKILQCITFVL
jgi:hypothetical protein